MLVSVMSVQLYKKDNTIQQKVEKLQLSVFMREEFIDTLECKLVKLPDVQVECKDSTDCTCSVA